MSAKPSRRNVRLRAVQSGYRFWGRVNPDGNPKGNLDGSPSATYRSQRNAVAAMPLGKRHWGAFGVSGREPQCEVQCEPQNEVQCEVFKTALESRFLLLTFCPTMQMGRRRANDPPPAHED